MARQLTQTRKAIDIVMLWRIDRHKVFNLHGDFAIDEYNRAVYYFPRDETSKERR